MHFARLRSTCPASATSYGTGCAGTAGLVNLEADRQPWLGATYRATCYGVTARSLGLDLFGLAPQQLALSTLHPTAGSSCQLLTRPDAATLRLPTQGTISSSFTLPNDPTFAGLALYQQMLVAEFDSSMAVTSMASSNAVRLTVGIF